MEIITLNKLTKAISNKVGINQIKARKAAEFVLDLFGYDDRIIDNVLEPEDRQLFYFLESEGMLTTGREANLLYNGREWLTHYWQLNKAIILQYAQGDTGRKRKAVTIQSTITEKKPVNVYGTLSDDVWNSRKVVKRSIIH